MQDVAAADRVARDHRDDRLRQAPHLHVQVGHVEAADRGALRDVPAVAAHVLVAARAEGVRPLAGQHDHADVGVLARALERVRDLDQRLGTERVAHLGPVDGDLRDPLSRLEADVLVLARRAPVGARADRSLGRRHRLPTIRGLDEWLTSAARERPGHPAVVTAGETLSYAELAERAAARELPAAARRPRRRRASSSRSSCTRRRSRHGDRAAQSGSCPSRGCSTAVPAGHARRHLHLRHDRRAAARVPHARELRGQRARVGGAARRRAGRPLALLPARVPRRRTVDLHALGDLRDDGRGGARVRRGRA